MKDWELIFDNLKSLGYSVGYASIIEAFVGEQWMVEASKNGQRWVVKAATLDEVFGELRGRGATE